MNFLTLATKNLQRRKARTFLTVLGVAIAIAVLFSLLSLNFGYENERTREFGMMKAIGASGGDITRTVLAETVFITVGGGVVGTASTMVGSSVIESFVKSRLPYSPQGSLISFDPQLIGFALLFSIPSRTTKSWDAGRRLRLKGQHRVIAAIIANFCRNK